MYAIKEQIEVAFKGKWMPATIEKIIREGELYGISYAAKKDFWGETLSKPKGIHRFTADKIRPR